MKHGYERGHKEMAGAYGSGKALKPKLKEGLRAQAVTTKGQLSAW